MPSEELAEIKRILRTHEKRISDLESLVKQKPTSPRREVSIKEFVLQKNASSDINKTLTAGYYLEHHRGLSPFNIRDLEELLREAREPLPKNISDVVNKNIEKGFIMNAKEKKNGLKAWTLTSTGDRFVENDLKEEN